MRRGERLRRNNTSTLTQIINLVLVGDINVGRVEVVNEQLVDLSFTPFGAGIIEEAEKAIES